MPARKTMRAPGRSAVRTQLAYALLAPLMLVAAAGCVFGPDNLPALYRQRDHFQKLIDDVEGRMLQDESWWASLPERRREYWREFFQRVQLEERERAIASMELITEQLDRMHSPGAADTSAGGG